MTFVSAIKFSPQRGHIEAALYALAEPFVAVAPAVWMKRLGVLPKEKMARKRAIKEEMQRRFPSLSVTLSTADAIDLISTH